MIYEIPKTNDASQTFECELNKVRYVFHIQLNVRSDIWTLDVSDAAGNMITAGVALVTGVDLLASNRFTIGKLFLIDYSGEGLDPTANNFDKFGLIWDDENGG